MNKSSHNYGPIARNRSLPFSSLRKLTNHPRILIFFFPHNHSPMGANLIVYGAMIATHVLTDSYNIRTDNELLGHKDLKTTMFHTHVWNRGGRGVRSLVDSM